jgi:hypothetical protein
VAATVAASTIAKLRTRPKEQEVEDLAALIASW